jgi:hypothetical protein
MRLYKTIYTDDAADPGRNERATWAGTLAGAAVDRKRLKSSGMRSITTDEVEVPTNKVELLAHLNMWEVVV